MPPSAIARTAEAGGVVPARLGARFAPARGDALAAGEGMLVPGRVRVGPLELGVSLESQGDRALYRVSVRNAGLEPLYLDSVWAGWRWQDHGARALRFLRHGWQSWSFTGARELDDAGEPPFPSGPWLRGMFHARGAPPADRAGWHESDLLTVVGASPEGAACAAGVLERGGELGVAYLRRDAGAVRVELEWVLETTLAPGAARELDPARIAVGADPVALLQEHADAHGREAGARTAARFQAGWCSWYHFFHAVAEDDLLRNLEALAAARHELPVDVVQLDDGYQRAVGDWLETNAKFPRGLAPVAHDVRAAGFVPGLWTAPFVAVPKSRVASERPEWLLREGEVPLRGLLHPEWNPDDAAVFALDLSRDDVAAHLESTFAALHDMGFAYHKLDFLYAAALAGDAADPDVTRAERLRRGLEAVRRGVGPRDFLLGCGCPLGAAVGVVDGMRIGPDVAPRWELDAPVAIPGIEATQPSTRNAVRNVLARAWMHRRLWLNDPDCLMARTRDTALSVEEARTLARAVGITGGMWIFSDDHASLDDEARALLRDTLDLARDVDGRAGGRAVRTLGLLADGFSHGAVVRDRGDVLAALVNGGDVPARRRLDEPPVEVELAPHASHLVRHESSPPVAVFCDFDGTFIRQDVGSTLAKIHAADRRPAEWARYERGEITAWEYNRRILDGLPCPPDELERFLESVEIDPGAQALVEWCRERRAPFRVLSDGFDRNLDRLAERFGVAFAYDANRLWYEGDVWRIAAGFPNPACGCGTGVCKRGRIEDFRRRNPGVPVAHVGNGRVSDLCGADAADRVYAKDSLAEVLRGRGETFVPFETLFDVVADLERFVAGDADREPGRSG